MSNLPGETPQNSLNGEQMNILESFVGGCMKVYGQDIQLIQYYDQASAYMRDYLIENYGVGHMSIDEYYALMAGVSAGASLTVRSCLEGKISLGETMLTMRHVANLFDSKTTAEPVEPILDRNGRLVLDLLLGSLARFQINLEDEEQRAAVSTGLRLGIDWTGGIANLNIINIPEAAEVVLVAFARLSPVQFEPS